MKTLLIALFGAILIAMLSVTTWASLRVPLWNAGPDVSDPWSIATLFDAYAGFLTFFVWVAYKERTVAGKVLWFVLIMLLGNIAMSVYVLRELARLPAGESFEALLLKRSA
jgi:di/tricarboxylate transporter